MAEDKKGLKDCILFAIKINNHKTDVLLSNLWGLGGYYGNKAKI